MANDEKNDATSRAAADKQSTDAMVVKENGAKSTEEQKTKLENMVASKEAELTKNKKRYYTQYRDLF